MAILFPIVLVLAVTTLLAHFSRRLNMPAVVGQLLAGILLGPAVLGWLHPTEVMHIFSELGVIVLMFLAGLESDLHLLRRFLKPSLYVACIGVTAPVLLMGIASKLLGMSVIESILVGIVFSATSVSISVDVLKEENALNRPEGATILGAAVADDILGVLLLSFFISFGGAHAAGEQPNMFLTIGEQLLFFGGVVVLIRWLAPLLMHLSEKLLVIAGPTLMAMIICLGTAALADFVGLSDVVGAFFAGVAVAQTPTKKEVDASIEPMGYAFFVPFFFVGIGLQMKLALSWADVLLIIVFTLLAVVTKLYGGMAGAMLGGFTQHQGLTIGAGMVSRGEMALITAQIGNDAGLFPAEQYPAIVIVILLTTLLSPFILKHYLHQTPVPAA
ncbi:cation:proton antiporter [Schleiferilactobacillus harbinensis]|uniref:Cation:proton antiporter n=1 Tax=Schleiferilactobacillus harbinensis TaxID=304207 RepID=A0ABU7SZ90_9LACO